MVDPRDTVTDLLARIRGGDRQAVNDLFGVLKSELHLQASRRLHKERLGHTLQTTALVNEVYVRLMAGATLHCNDRAHFLTTAAKVMRQILVDHARSHASRQQAEDAHEGVQRVEDDAGLDEVVMDLERRVGNLIRFDAALERLAKDRPRAAVVVEKRFFAGLTLPKVAELLDVSLATVEGDWRLARAWLYQELRDFKEAM